MRPSRRVLDAAVAALAEVVFGGEICDSALPAADFDAFPGVPLERTLDELRAALLRVTFVAIQSSPLVVVGNPTSRSHEGSGWLSAVTASMRWPSGSIAKAA